MIQSEPFTHSPGFGGLCAVVAAVVAFAAAWLSTRQRRLADAAALAESQRHRRLEEHDQAVQRCWDRYVWLVDQADKIGIDLVISLLSRLTESAKKLDEPDLVAFAREFSLELYAEVNGSYPLADSSGTMEDAAQSEEPG